MFTIFIRVDEILRCRYAARSRVDPRSVGIMNLSVFVGIQNDSGRGRQGKSVYFTSEPERVLYASQNNLLLTS